MITVFAGPMFSGKTTKLIQTMVDNYPPEESVLFAHYYNTRDFLTHDKKVYAISSCPIKSAEELDKYLEANITYDIAAIFIDELQFFDTDILSVIEKYSDSYTFYLAGLDKDFKGEPFATTAGAMAIADSVEKMAGVCKICKDNGKESEATYSLRSIDISDRILVGGDDMYIPVCRTCFKIKQRGKCYADYGVWPLWISVYHTCRWYYGV